MLYREPLLLAIPQELLEDERLSWMHLIAFTFITKGNGNGEAARKEETAKRLRVNYRRLAEIQADLHECGHLARVGKGKGARYLPINSDAVAHSTIKEFLQFSTQGFSKISDDELIELESRYPASKILHHLEVLEWTYRNSERKKPGKPLDMLSATLKKAVTPDKGYVPRFWKEDAARKEANEAARQALADRQRKDEAARAQRSELEKEFDRYLESITSQERDIIRTRAIQRIKSNGGLVPSKVLQEIQIKAAMVNIYQEGREHGHV